MSEDEIPSLDVLSKTYQGISVTAPYKKHFFAEVSVPEDIKSIGGINAIDPSRKLATNTDFLALEFLIPEMLDQVSPDLVIILGDGTMSKVSRMILKKNKVHPIVFARSMGHKIEELNLSDTRSKLVINCCFREMTYKGKVDASTTFWDYNYAVPEQQKLIEDQKAKYINGERLLREQAKKALGFWGIPFSE